MRRRALAACALLATACGSTPDATDDGGPPSADAAPPPDAAPPADAGVYPAFSSDLPRVVDQGGAVLSSPKVVTVTWNADPNQALGDALGDAIGASAYWTATTSEYGVGPATSEHVHLATAPPAKMSDTALDAFISAQVDGAPASGWPANDADTVYVLYVPEAMELTSSGANDCTNEDGYHDELATTANPHIVYAVVNEGCRDTQDVVSFTTEVASHEIVESATDPHAETDSAWTGFDPDHYAWDVWNTEQAELADACEYFPEANYQLPAPFDFFVQRSWSNASAAAGHDPCVPLPSGAFYEATPLGLDTITLTVKSAPLVTNGYSIPVGAKRTIQLGLASDAPHAPWSVQIVEGDGFTTVASPHLVIAPHATSGQNGDVIDVDVTTLSTKASGVLVTALSSAPNEPTRYMPFLIATE